MPLGRGIIILSPSNERFALKRPPRFLRMVGLVLAVAVPLLCAFVGRMWFTWANMRQPTFTVQPHEQPRHLHNC